MVAAHNLLDPIWPASQLLDQQWPVWVALHSSMSTPAGPFLLVFRYPLLPWLGVMLLGFGIASVFERAPARRNAILLAAGAGITAGFCLLRAWGVYGDPNPWQQQPGGAVATVIDFLNLTKYPPSLLFLMMTLGPAAMLCAVADRISGGVPGMVKDALITFGRAPFAFYVAHLYLLHLASVLLGVLQGFSLDQMMTSSRFYPRGFGVGLPAVYLVWAARGGAALSVVPLGRGGEGAAPGLVAELCLNHSRAGGVSDAPGGARSALSGAPASDRGAATDSPVASRQDILLSPAARSLNS